MAAPVLLGTSGYAFEDWTGPFYPKRLKARDKIAFYAERFPTLELNATFYRLPTAEWLTDIADRLPAGYPMVVKLFQGVTHERATPETLTAFREALAPLIERGHLAGVLVQYPQRTHNTTAARADLIHTLRGLAGLDPIVEFRHRTWDADAVRSLLHDHGAAWCCVDAPDLDGLLPPVAAHTADTAVIRFHGRNADTWYGGDGALRYDYLYRDDELLSWLPAIEELSGKARRMFLFFNNCHRGQSVTSARRMSELLVERGLAKPLPEPPPRPEQRRLFD